MDANNFVEKYNGLKHNFVQIIDQKVALWTQIHATEDAELKADLFAQLKSLNNTFGTLYHTMRQLEETKREQLNIADKLRQEKDRATQAKLDKRRAERNELLQRCINNTRNHDSAYTDRLRKSAEEAERIQKLQEEYLQLKEQTPTDETRLRMQEIQEETIGTQYEDYFRTHTCSDDEVTHDEEEYEQNLLRTIETQRQEREHILTQLDKCNKTIAETQAVLDKSRDKGCIIC